MAYNYFDNIKLDTSDVMNKVLNSKVQYSQFRFPKIKLLLNICLRLTKISPEFIFSYISTKWFKEFNKFWVEILNGRPIDIVDYHFLRLLYRVRFQNLNHTDESNDKTFLEAWQKDESIYLLFGNIWKYAKSAYLDFLPYFFFLPKSGKVLEYGCGIAPFTTAMKLYFPSRKYSYEMSDIMQISFLYAIYRLSNYKEIKYHILEPHNNLVKDKMYDIIICQTVLEHVPNPLQVVQSFYNTLENNGILVFDYIKGDGKGLDSKKSSDEREAVLDFINSHFTIIKGNIDAKKNVGLCVVKKR
jgi:SAM-dependent methyltransferase